MGRIVRCTVGWIVLFCVYVVLVGPPSAGEWVLGALFAAAAVAAGSIAAATERLHLGFSARWLTLLPGVVGSILTDAARLAYLLARSTVHRMPLRGELHKVPLSRYLSSGSGAGRRAYVTMMLSLRPGTVVVDVDEQTDVLLLHVMGDEPGRRT